MARPTSHIVTWASNEVDVDGDFTKLTPPDENQATGTIKKQPVPRQWWNFFNNYSTSWITFLASDRYTTGYVFYNTGNLTVDADFDPWDGIQANWSQAGPAADANGVSVYTYTRL